MIRQGKVVFAHIETTPESARQEAENYREDRRNQGNWTIRIYPRAVRANSVTLNVWVVVVREKASAA